MISSIIRRLSRTVARSASPKEPLPGISLQIDEQNVFRLGKKIGSEVEELEIGATGPSELQVVWISSQRRAILKMSAEQARWLAEVLQHWAQDSETISLN